MDDYDLLSEIGKGMGGVVYLARDGRNGEFKAVKQVSIDERRPTRKREALLREANILSALSHPHIVKCHDFFYLEPNHLCIVQEYCDGGTLADQILSAKEAGILISEPLIWKWLTQILLALHYLHNEKQVIHRDLKAANVFLVKGRTVKVGDFGIAKMLENEDLATSTCVGTPCYLSPELVQDIPYTTQSDMWSLGCLLFELISLRRPFDANNLLSLFAKISRAELEHPLDPEMRYTEELHRIVDGLLQPDPLQRFSAGKLLKDPNLIKSLSDLIEEKEKLISFGKKNKNGDTEDGGRRKAPEEVDDDVKYDTENSEFFKAWIKEERSTESGCCAHAQGVNKSSSASFDVDENVANENRSCDERPSEINDMEKDEEKNNVNETKEAFIQRKDIEGSSDELNASRFNSNNHETDTIVDFASERLNFFVFGEKIFHNEDIVKLESLEGASYEDDFEEAEEDREEEEEKSYSDDYEEEEEEDLDEKGYEDDFDEFDSSDEEVLLNAKNVRGVYCDELDVGRRLADHY